MPRAALTGYLKQRVGLNQVTDGNWVEAHLGRVPWEGQETQPVEPVRRGGNYRYRQPTPEEAVVCKRPENVDWAESGHSLR